MRALMLCWIAVLATGTACSDDEATATADTRVATDVAPDVSADAETPDGDTGDALAETLAETSDDAQQGETTDVSDEDAADTSDGAPDSDDGDVCTPDCGSSCNTTSCGVSCECSGGELCDFDDTCRAPTSIVGNTCATPGVLNDGTATLPSQVSGDISASGPLTDDHNAAACGIATPNGLGVKDQVWRFTAPADDAYAFTVTATGDADPIVYLIDGLDCSGPCLGFRDAPEGEADTVAVAWMPQGSSVHVVVDARTTVLGGAYDLEVDKVCACAPRACGMLDTCAATMCTCTGGDDCIDNVCTPQPGDSCGAPWELQDPEGDGVWEGSGDLSMDATPYHDAMGCAQLGTLNSSGEEAADHVWKFVAPEAGDYEATLTSSEGDLFIYAFDDPACDDASCLGYVDSFTFPFPETMALPGLTSGDAIYLVVDSWKAGEEGPYELSVGPICESDCTPDSCDVLDSCGDPCTCAEGASCDTGLDRCVATVGDTCAQPHTLEMTDTDIFAGQGNLWVERGLSPAYDAATCPGVGFPSGAPDLDEVWRFTAPSSGNWSVTVLASNGDIQIYAFDSDACDQCVDRANANGSGEAETLTLSASADDDFFIVVDGITGLPGEYTIAVAKQ